MQRVRKWLTFVGVSTSHPLAFLVVGVYVIVWLAFDPGSFNWQSAATVATWIMTLFIRKLLAAQITRQHQVGVELGVDPTTYAG